MTTLESGQQAESAAARYLESAGYCIVERNWRTKFCEIDLVAKKDGEICFVEVKYRRSSRSGGGFEYITPAKADRLRRAALAWVTYSDWDGGYSIGAIQVSGDLSAPVIDFLPNALL